MKIIKLLSTSLVLLSLSINLSAQSTLQSIVDRGQFRVGMSGDQAPFNMKSTTGSHIGYDVDLAQALADAMGVELIIVDKPFGDLLTALQNGEIDAVISGMTMNPERSLQARFTKPYTLTGKSIVTKSSVLAKISKASDINDSRYTVTCIEGSNAKKFIERFIPDVKLITVASYKEGVDLVLADKADALLADYEVCIMSAMEHARDGLVTLSQPLTIEPVSIALPMDDAHLQNLIDNYLASLEMRGTLEMLEELWFGDDSWMHKLKK